MSRHSQEDHTAGQLRVLQSLSRGRLLSRVVRWLTDTHGRGGRSILDSSLDIIAGDRSSVSVTSLVGALMLRGILEMGTRAFGGSLADIRENLSNVLFRRALSSVITGLVDFGPQRPFTPGAPFQVVWNVTRTCNLRCKHCYENAGRRGRDELDTEQALRAIDIMADEGVVFLAFSGGEPTLRPDILTLIRRAADRGMYVAAATNGTTFADRERVRRFKEAGLSFAQISLDGVNAETHDSFRGVPGAFARTIEGIKNCVAEGLFVEIAMTVTHYNLHEVPKAIELAERLGARWFMIYNFVPIGRGAEIADADLTPSEREELLRLLWDRISSKSDPGAMEVLTTAPQLGRVPLEAARDSTLPGCQTGEMIFPTHFSNARLPSQMTRLSEFIGGCGAGRFYLAMEPNGDLYPCVFFPHTPEVRIGNILHDDLHKIWRQSGVLRMLRDKDLLKDHCGSCENRYVCGGCRARAIQYFGDLLAPDPGCKYNAAAWNALRTGEMLAVTGLGIQRTVSH